MDGQTRMYLQKRWEKYIYLGRLKDNLPRVIVRPTVVTSTYKEPFPGWIQGFR